MNNSQQNLVWIGISLVVLMGLIPPWCQHGPNGMIEARHYAPIFLPPYGCAIDTDRLFLQWLLIAIIYAAWTRVGNPPKTILFAVIIIFTGWLAFYIVSTYPAMNPLNLLSAHSSTRTSGIPDASMLPYFRPARRGPSAPIPPPPHLPDVSGLTPLSR